MGLLVNGSPVALPKLAGTAAAAQQATAGSKSADDNGKDEKQPKEAEVPCDPDELIAAIVHANANRGARLKLEPKCRYTLTAFQDDNGLPVITQRISIEGNGATIVRAANAEAFRIFNVASGGDLELRDLTVKGGDSQTDAGGGALLVQEGGRATLVDTTLTLNRSASFGGAIANHGITKVLGDGHGKDSDARGTGSQVRNNSAGAGGGIYSTGSLTVERSRLSYNTAEFFGAGLKNSGGVTNITSARIDHNVSANDSGGIEAEGSAITRVKDSRVNNNTSGGAGGGIGNFGATLYVQHTNLRHNTADSDGGGISNVSGLAVVEDSKVNDNTSRAFGGGIANSVVEIVPLHTGRNLAGIANDDAEVVVRRTEINKNRAVGAGADSQGGGIANFNHASVSLTRSEVIENLTTNPPGGIFSRVSQVTVDDDSVIIKNRPTNCQGNPPGVVIPNCFG
ncbi:right-handed parallel beta-helix repeat-containing protein [Actinopolymorpha pittospori]|uniref:Outer membrane repeat protein n=1 Tax=Actinopolymorpha pittospori TaxID=648752 RepID=A0A927N1D1_9ACTN|nr:right-handed parallel beta-helix repeat-containing protein [Actinopolymorpha pittospori]MBE1610244.1 putative outer membrane repeat protein [Actinopolymorpha pittospori]